jgi:ketosteroid isomerase-like protein
MPSDNKQLIRQVYDAYSRGDIETVLQNMADDVEWNAPGGAPFSGHRHGRDQMRAFFQEMRQAIEVQQFDIDDLIADGDKVAVLGRQRATVRETGRHFETQWVHVYTLRGGKIVHGQAFTDTHAVASAFGESTRERQALTGSLGITHPTFSGRGTPE